MEVKLVNMVITTTETIRLIRDGEKGGGREDGDCIPIATLSTPE